MWGGERLCPYKGLPQSIEPIGESWEVSAVPSSPSIIANGEYAGRDLISVIDEQPEAILGKAVCEKYHGQLPLLVKFIDAKRDLSIQVHPDDEMALREHGKMGKSEMWYIIDAQPGSFLYAGFKKEITPEEYKQRIADGSIIDVLARHEVHAGDSICLPVVFMPLAVASCWLKFSSHPMLPIVSSIIIVREWMGNLASCIPT